jgi:hypothetical protein
MVHQTNKVVVLRGFQQMRHFMHDDIFQALRGLFSQIGVKPELLAPTSLSNTG